MLPRFIASIFLLLVILGSAAAQTPKFDLSLPPGDPASSVHPRKFGLPGGIGQTRGWYVWHKFDPETWRAEVSNEASGEKYTVRVLPWLTTYRHLIYGAHPDELLPGERVNLFFNPDNKLPRAFLVHFQDELCQMKGHNHAWQIESVTKDGFTARVMAGDKLLDELIGTFTFDPKCRIWRDGKLVEAARPTVGERVLLTWVYDEKKRVVKLFTDAASLDAIQAEMRKRTKDRITKDGMTAFVEEVTKDKTRVLVFATWWQQAGEWKAGQKLQLRATDKAYRPIGEPVDVRLVSRKNLGTYGSGCSELIVDGLDAKQSDIVRGWGGGKVVRVLAP